MTATPLIKTFVALAGANALGSLIRFAYLLVLARQLGPDLLGVYSFGIAFCLALMAFTNFGQNLFLARHLGKRRGRVDLVLSHSLTLRVSLSAIGMAGALAVLAFLQHDVESFIALGVLLTAMISRAFVGSARECHVALEDSGWIPRYEASFRGAEAVIGSVWLLAGGGLFTVCMVHAAVWFTEAVIAMRLVRRRTGWRIRFGTSWRLLRQIARESISYALGMGMFALFPQFGIVALMMMKAGNGTVANYALAAQLIFTAAMPALVFSDALIPAIRRLQRSGRGTEIGQLSKLFGLLLVGYTVVAVLTAAFGPWLVDLLFGQRYEGTFRALAVMSWALAPYSVMVITFKALYAVGARARAMAVLTVANIAQAAVLAGLSGMGGFDGAVFAMLISSWLGCLLGVVLLRPRLPVSGTWWWAGPVVMTVVAAGIVGAGLIRGPWSALTLAASCLLAGYGLRFFTVSDFRGILSRLGIIAGDPTQGVFQVDIHSDRPTESPGHLRVCLLTSNLPRWPGDATTPFVLHLAQDLCRLGVDVEVLAPHAPGAKRAEFLDGVPVSRFRYFWPEKGETLCYQGGALLNLRRSWGNWLKLPLFIACEMVAVMHLFRRRPFDVIHAHWILPQGFVAVLAGRLTRARVVVTVHGGDIFGLRGAVLRWFKRMTLRNASAITANSSVTEAAVREVVGPSWKIHRIPMGVSVPNDGTSLDAKNGGRREGAFARVELRRLYARSNGPLLIFVGRLIEEKGVGDLIRAAAMLETEMPDLTLLIMGDGPARNAFEGLASSLHIADRIHFTGWIESQQVSAYLAAGDIFVGPSKPAPDGGRVEAQGLTFCEAMAAGIPVIATRCGGIVDVVKDGETGLLVDTSAPEQIAAAIRRLVKEPELGHRLAAAGRRRVKQNFSRQATAEKFLSLFTNLVGPTASDSRADSVGALGARNER